MSMTPPPSRARQRPACEECRRRKLRCDGKKPQCSMCEHAGTNCETDTHRVPRGPKKGYLASLQNQIATLESRLQAQEQGRSQEPEGPRWLNTSFSENGSSVPPLRTTPPPVTSTARGRSTLGQDVIAMPNLYSPLSVSEASFEPFFDVNTMPAANLAMSEALPSTSPMMELNQTTISITEMMQNELDQIYFDRMHSAVPILHQRRYLSWSKSPVKTRSRSCLQYAVWATASLMSTQFHHLQEMLYHELKRMLACTSFASQSTGQQLAVDVEIAQAWVLTAMYEFIKAYHHEACISACRAFRLVQLMRLYEIDQTSSETLARTNIDDTDPIMVEEKRRVFWLSFVLEALYNMRNHLPLVMTKQMTGTFLPMPDHDFQNGQRTKTGTLNDYIVNGSQTVRSPLNECILLIAMCAQTLSYAQQDHQQQSNGSTCADCNCFEWQQWLNDVLSLRLRILAQEYPSLVDSSDPMLLFANFMAQASVMYLWQETRSMDAYDTLRNANRSNRPALVNEHKQRAYSAVDRMTELARSLIDLPLSKIHPFTPIPLFLTLEFLARDVSRALDVHQLYNLVDVLRQLANANGAHQSYIELFSFSQNITSLT